MKYINKLLTIGFIGAALISCDAEKSSQDVSPIGNTDNMATATVSADVSGGEVAEGTTITYTITQDRPVVFGVTYAATISGDVDGNDYEAGSLTIPAYSTEGTLTVTFLEDMFPEVTENAEVLITVGSVASGSLLKNGDFEVAHNYSVTNVNSTDALTVGLDWNEDQAVDLDMVMFDANGAELAFQATADVPEINTFIPTAAPDGTYFIGIDPYEIVTPQFEFTFAFSEPNGEITTFSGVFDTENLDAYTVDVSPSLGADIYRVVKIVKTGSDFTITQLP